MSKLKDYIKVFKKHQAEKKKQEELIKKKERNLSMTDKKAYSDMLREATERHNNGIIHPSIIWWTVKVGLGFLLFSLLMYYGFGIDFKLESLQIFAGLLEIAIILTGVVILSIIIMLATIDRRIFKIKKELLQ